MYSYSYRKRDNRVWRLIFDNNKLITANNKWKIFEEYFKESETSRNKKEYEVWLKRVEEEIKRLK